MSSFRPASSPQVAMPEPAASPEHPRFEPRSPVGRFLARQLIRYLQDVPVLIELPDGTRATTSTAPPVATVTVKDFRILPRLLLNPGLVFGQAFEAGRVEVRGDLVGFLEAVYRRQNSRRRPGTRYQGAADQGTASLRAARRNIQHHYDLGNDFFRLWLDPELLYTCAYYPSPDDDLDAAQVAKMELVCRKLRLKPGERVVEAGCGWGSLALHMARRYGVTVSAYNISTEQVRYARERAVREGLDGRVEFVDDDYRRIRGTFDVFVSVGMLEHVGLANYTTLGEVIHKSLPAGSGRGLIHFIGRNRPEPLDAWIRARIFPGAYPPALSEMVQGVLEPWDFSVVDVENLRLHYARTLGHWLARFDAAASRVAALFDERFVRAWRLYLAGSQAAFLAGSLQLFQVVFARGSDNRVPWTRGAHAVPPAAPETRDGAA